MSCDIEPFRDELVKPFGDRADARIAVWRQTCWYGKPRFDFRERLGYALARGLLNACEVVDIRYAETATMLDGGSAIDALGPNTELVRLAQSYKPGELPIQDLDAAIAAELVFSVWTRRRDPSCWNRGYAAGIPAFFDHHIAFGAEEPNKYLNTFFRGGGDGGYPLNWRVEQFEPGYIPTAKQERDYEQRRSGFTLAIHRVSNIDRFLAATEVIRASIAALSDHGIRETVYSVGAPTSVAELLVNTRNEIDQGVQRLLEIVLPAR